LRQLGLSGSGTRELYKKMRFLIKSQADYWPLAANSGSRWFQQGLRNRGRGGRGRRFLRACLRRLLRPSETDLGLLFRRARVGDGVMGRLTFRSARLFRSPRTADRGAGPSAPAERMLGSLSVVFLQRLTQRPAARHQFPCGFDETAPEHSKSLEGDLNSSTGIRVTQARNSSAISGSFASTPPAGYLNFVRRRRSAERWPAVMRRSFRRGSSPRTPPTHPYQRRALQAGSWRPGPRRSIQLVNLDQSAVD
jgi:hypothetical protein